MVPGRISATGPGVTAVVEIHPASARIIVEKREVQGGAVDGPLVEAHAIARAVEEVDVVPDHVNVAGRGARHGSSLF